MYEFLAALISLTGASFIIKPQFLFGSDLGNNLYPLSFDGIVVALLGAVFASSAYVLVRMLGTTAKMPWPNVRDFFS